MLSISKLYNDALAQLQKIHGTPPLFVLQKTPRFLILNIISKFSRFFHTYFYTGLLYCFVYSIDT